MLKEKPEERINSRRLYITLKERLDKMLDDEEGNI